MQTFLPYPDFAQTAACLDSRRLGKQRVEAFQILRALTIPDYGWQHHPAVRMWRGYESGLQSYLNVCITEWVRRGFRNSMLLQAVPESICTPPWLGEPAFHAAHRSNLLRKDPVFYGQYGWTEPPDLPYVWPV